MKKINLLKGIALSVSALMVFSLSGCDYISDFIGNINNGGNSNISGDDNKNEPTLTISQAQASVAVGGTVQLHAFSSDGSQITWGSDDTNIATVEDGLVTGIAEGDTLIWAQTESSKVNCFVTVTADQTPPSVDTITLSQTELSLEVGASATLTANCSVAGATINWTSSPSGYVSVVNGKVTAIKEGWAAVTASVVLPSGTISANCIVTIKAPADSNKTGYDLVWCDEFNGTSLDMTKWSYQTGIRDIYHDFDTQNWFWGNEELQYYTEDAVSVSDGSLKITATKRDMSDGRTYSSGRIVTRDKKSWTYGYFEARMRTPTGNGMWPAFWMLPQPSSYANTENKYGGWPYSGEIDIMEAKGRLLDKIDTTLHFGPRVEGTWESHYISNDKYPGGYQLSSPTDQWHTYAVEWTADYIKWFADDKEVMSLSNNKWYTRSSAPTTASSPFDQPFYILFNLAVGGKYDCIQVVDGVPIYAQPDASFSSATMEVDYVRVYEKK